MSGTFVLFPQMAAAPATLPAGWDDQAIIAQLSPELLTKLRREVRQMAEWNRRAVLLKGLASAAGEGKASAEDQILRINRWFADEAWRMDVDLTLQPIGTSIDPARVAMLAKLAGQAAQRIAAINTFVDAVNTATLLANALQSEGGAMTALGDETIMSVAVDGIGTVAKSPTPIPIGRRAGAPATESPPSGPDQTSSAADVTALKASLELITARVGINEAAAKLALGTIAASGEAAGKLTLGENSGLLESTLLAADTLARCAGKVRKEMEQALGGDRPPIIVTGADLPDVGLWRAVQGRIRALGALAERARAALVRARQTFGETTETDIGAAFAVASVGAAVTAVGTIVSNLANLASYFQTSWTTKGFVVDGVDDGLFAKAVASNLIEGGFEVYAVGTTADEPMALALFDAVLGHRQTGEEVKAAAEALQTSLVPAQGPGNGGTPSDLLARATSAGAAIGAATAVIEACDALIANLTTPNAAGVSPLTMLSIQASMGSLMDRAALALRLRVHRSLGGLYAKENGKIREWFRNDDTPNLHVTGGAVVSYELLAADGRILAAGMLRDQTDYLPLDEVDGWLDKRGHA